MKMFVDGKVRDIKSMYVGVNGEPLKVYDKEEGVLHEEYYEVLIRSMISYNGTLTELCNYVKAEDNVKEEESLWQKLLKKLKKSKK